MEEPFITAKPFIEDFDLFREHCDALDYSGVRNPVDGITYPGISTDIPSGVLSEIQFKVSAIMGFDITPHFTFLRLSLSDVPVPHQAHTDSTMGDFSLMLYLNRQKDCQGGTSLVSHTRTGLNSDPVNDFELSVWQRDVNDPDKWKVDFLCEMDENKAFIFPAYLMHRAEPVGGFGDNTSNGRLVLTSFFSEARDQ